MTFWKVSVESQMRDLNLKQHFEKCHLRLKWGIWTSNAGFESQTTFSKMSSEPQIVDLGLKSHFQQCHLNQSSTRLFRQKNHIIWTSESIYMAVRSLPKKWLFESRNMAYESQIPLGNLPFELGNMADESQIPQEIGHLSFENSHLRVDIWDFYHPWDPKNFHTLSHVRVCICMCMYTHSCQRQKNTIVVVSAVCWWVWRQPMWLTPLKNLQTISPFIH